MSGSTCGIGVQAPPLGLAGILIGTYWAPVCRWACPHAVYRKWLYQRITRGLGDERRSRTQEKYKRCPHVSQQRSGSNGSLVS